MKRTNSTPSIGRPTGAKRGKKPATNRDVPASPDGISLSDELKPEVLLRGIDSLYQELADERDGLDRADILDALRERLVCLFQSDPQLFCRECFARMAVDISEILAVIGPMFLRAARDGQSPGQSDRLLLAMVEQYGALFVNLQRHLMDILSELAKSERQWELVKKHQREDAESGHTGRSSTTPARAYEHGEAVENEQAQVEETGHVSNSKDGGERSEGILPEEVAVQSPFSLADPTLHPADVDLIPLRARRRSESASEGTPESRPR